MKRCIICDSTEHHDTLADLGINNPITHWHIDKDDHTYMCNRCERSVANTLGHYTDLDVLINDNEDNINEDPLDMLEEEEDLLYIEYEIDDYPEDEYKT